MIDQASEIRQDPSYEGITFAFADDGHTLVEFPKARFSKETASLIVGQFIRIASEIARFDANQLVSDVVGAQRTDIELIEKINDTDVSFEFIPVHRYLSVNAKSRPGEIACIASDGQYTYEKLNQYANSVAQELRHQSVRKGDVVAVHMGRHSAASLAAIYGILKLGAVYLPIDPAWPDARKNQILSTARTKAAVTTTLTNSSLFDALGIPTLCAEQALAMNAVEDISCNVGPDDLCYIIFTSGSTGAPKGVMVDHGGISNRILWMKEALDVTDREVILHKTPLVFDVSVWEVFLWAAAGAKVVVLNHGLERDPDQILDAIETHRVTLLHFVPSMLDAFLSFITAIEATGGLQTLRMICCSGEALQGYHVTAFKNLNLAATLVNLYGPTEASVDVTCLLESQMDTRRQISIGYPIANTKLYVLNEQGNFCPTNVPGELYIEGIQVAHGYVGAPDLTAKSFSEATLAPGRRRYRTGDLARIRPDGQIEFLGRIDHQVKINGHRVELGEIEHCIRVVPGVLECSAFLAKSGRFAGSLCAAYTAAAEIAPADVRAALSQRLPNYMIPSQLLSVAAIPTTANGKRDTKQLEKLL
ncbi:amino acid adenylation domain-containing protein [Azospirillum argentinense]